MTKSTGLRFKRFASLAEKIEHFGIPEPNSGCLLWLGWVDAKGYAMTGRSQSVARLILNTPPHLMALHTCDNPGCVNRDHLYSGTRSDNMRDVRKRDRITKPNGNRKLTAAQVNAVRASTEDTRSLVAQLNVSRTLIQKIRSGKRHTSHQARKFGFA